MIARLFLLAFVLLAAPQARAEGRILTDMAGRSVVVPDPVVRVHSASYPLTVLMYVLAPDLLVAVNTPPNDKQLAFLPSEIGNLPDLGGMPGHGPGVNPEEMLALRPQLILSWLDPMGAVGETERLYGRTGLPIAYVKLDSIKDYPAALTFLGDLLGRKERAAELSQALSSLIARVEQGVAAVPADKKTRYYYAEGPDGLATECANSFHIEAMRLAGGVNIDACEQSNHVGMERVSLEQVIAGRPDFILALDPRFQEMASAAPEWRHVEALAKGRVATIPRLPFNWLDRPPSFMRALGALWLANLFYPEQVPVDMAAETKSFYKTFFKRELKDEDVARILH